MIDRPGRGLLRRGAGGARARGGPGGGGRGGGGGARVIAGRGGGVRGGGRGCARPGGRRGGGHGGGQSGSSEVFLQRAMAASARGRAARQKKSIAHIHIW